MVNNLIAYSLLGCVFFLLIWKAGRSFPLLYLFLFTFYVQYIFSTYLIYNEYEVLKSQMPIGQNQLFSFMIPAMLALFIGVFVLNRDLPLKDLVIRIDQEEAFYMGLGLLVVAYSFEAIAVFEIASLGSVLSFTKYLKYVAAFCFLFSKSRLKILLIGLIYVELVFEVLQSGVFMDFIIWSTYLFFMINLAYRFAFGIRAGFVAVGVLVLIVIQSVKGEYRAATWSGKREAGISLFTELAERSALENTGASFFKAKGVVGTIGRLNQGWHLGMVLRRVPKKEPFSEGQEMAGDIAASFTPRLLFPDKKVTHTNEKFYKYTGHKLSKKTAMTIGILGDFYINFGWWGSLAMLFVFGALISWLLRRFIILYVIPDPINVVWIPFMFTYLVRADNDFYVFFNGLVKGFLVFLLVNFVRKQIWPTRYWQNIR